MERRPLAEHRLHNGTPPVTSASSCGLNLDDLPQLKQQIAVDAQQYERKAAALEQSIQWTVRTLQSSLKRMTHRAEALEVQLAAAIASQREAMQQLEGERAAFTAANQQLTSLNEALKAQARDAATLQAQHESDNEEKRLHAASLSQREKALLEREAVLEAREASFARSMGPAQEEIERIRARAQELEAEAKRRVEAAQAMSDAAMARKFDADRQKRSVEEWSELQLAELAHRHRLWVDALAEQENVVEHRTMSCVALEARLSQRASDINAESAARERVRWSELDAQAEAIETRKASLEGQERALRNARRVLESERLELLNVVQEEEANWLEEGSGSDEQRRRLLVRLRRVRSLIDRTTAHVPPSPSTMISSEVSASASPSASVYSLATAARRTAAQEDGGGGGNDSDGATPHVWQQPFRTPSSSNIASSSWHQQRRSSASSTTHVSSSSSSTTTLGGVAATGTGQRLQRSPPERRTIASPLKLRGAGGSDGPLT